MDVHFLRAQMLLGQSRPDLAESELRQSLAENPDNGLAHSYLALCLSERSEFAQAMDEAEAGIGSEPGASFSQYALASVFLARNRLDEARTAIDEALRLDPAEPTYYALLANIRFNDRNWQAALDAAEQGLACDPEHVTCNNLRAMALTKLGRKAEAGATMAATLARDPDNAMSHANQGWNCLHQRNSRAALEHFREALRLDPNLDYARAGMVEALKSRNIIYALMLRYFLWMSSLGGQARWGIVIGGYLGFQFLGNFADEHPEWAPFIIPLLVLYVVFAVMTWIAYPLFNLLLRVSRFGRHVLSRDQTVASNWLGGLLLAAITMLGIWLWTDHVLALMAAVYFGLLMLPVPIVFQCDVGWPRRYMAMYTMALAAMGPLYLVLTAIGSPLASLTVTAFSWGSFLSAFVANYLTMASVRN